MQQFKILFVLLLCSVFTSICYAQKNTVALTDTKSFYASENKITRLVDALKLANPNFINLTTEEKVKEFARTVEKCRGSKNNEPEATTIKLAAEEAVCSVIKDITDSLEKFRKKQAFVILADISECDKALVLDLCYATTDVTKQFVDEYNSLKK
jgi:hypothetical protein